MNQGSPLQDKLSSEHLDGFSLIVPAYNEESRLPRTLQKYLDALERVGWPFEVIVVSDGTRDRTSEVAKMFQNRGVKVLEFGRKLGKGGAVMAGLHSAIYNYVGFVDADGPIPPHDLLGLARLLENVDCVVASRWTKGSAVLRNEPLFNRFVGRAWNIMVRSLLFLPFHDTQCGAKFVRRAVIKPTLKAVDLTNRAFDVSFLYHIKKGGFRMIEVPVTWTHDPDTRMPIGKAIPIMMLSLVGIRLMNLPLAYRIPETFVKIFKKLGGSA